MGDDESRACLACGKVYINGSDAGEAPKEVGHCPRCVLMLEQAVNQQELDDVCKDKSESITGKAITRCKDCAAWECDFELCMLGPPKLGQATETDARDWFYPKTGPNDGCTDAPDWTVKLPPSESEEIHDRISMLYRKLCKRLDGQAMTDGALEKSIGSLSERIQDLENTRREDTDWADSTNKDLLKLSNEISKLKSRLHHIDGTPRFISEGDPLPSLVEVVETLKAILLGPSKPVVVKDGMPASQQSRLDRRIDMLEQQIKDSTRLDATGSFIDIVFDGPSGFEAPRFVEVENDRGESIKFGEWVKRDDGYHVIRFRRFDLDPNPTNYGLLFRQPDGRFKPLERRVRDLEDLLTRIVKDEVEENGLPEGLQEELQEAMAEHPPHNLDSEALVIATVIEHASDKGILGGIAAKALSTLTSDDFYSPAHARIWSIMLSLKPAGRDITSYNICKEGISTSAIDEVMKHERGEELGMHVMSHVFDVIKLSAARKVTKMESIRNDGHCSSVDTPEEPE